MIELGLDSRVRWATVFLGVLILWFVIRLIRHRKLQERYAILWVVSAVILVLIPLGINHLDFLIYGLGIDYPPALLFLLAILALGGLMLQYSIVLSRLSEQCKNLIQSVALLRKRLDELEEQRKADRSVERDKDSGEQAGT